MRGAALYRSSNFSVCVFQILEVEFAHTHGSPNNAQGISGFICSLFSMTFLHEGLCQQPVVSQLPGFHQGPSGKLLHYPFDLSSSLSSKSNRQALPNGFAKTDLQM